MECLWVAATMLRQRRQARVARAEPVVDSGRRPRETGTCRIERRDASPDGRVLGVVLPTERVEVEVQMHGGSGEEEEVPRDSP